MAYYDQPPTYPGAPPSQPPAPAPAPPLETMPYAEDSGPALPDAPPPQIPPAPNNSPLALTGSFAQPGTSGAKAFRTGGFFAPDRLVGGGMSAPIRFGQGIGFGPGGASSPLTGGGPDGRPGENDDRIRAFISSLQRG